jgi:hypothetical protein
MNCCADIGVPSGCQNVIIIMCWLPGCSVQAAGYRAHTFLVNL